MLHGNFGFLYKPYLHAKVNGIRLRLIVKVNVKRLIVKVKEFLLNYTETSSIFNFGMIAILILAKDNR